MSALYRTDIPISPSTDGVYKIGRVDFTEEEFESARNLVTGVIHKEPVEIVTDAIIS